MLTDNEALIHWVANGFLKNRNRILHGTAAEAVGTGVCGNILFAPERIWEFPLRETHSYAAEEKTGAATQCRFTGC